MFQLQIINHACRGFMYINIKTVNQVENLYFKFFLSHKHLPLYEQIRLATFVLCFFLKEKRSIKFKIKTKTVSKNNILFKISLMRKNLVC